MEVFIPALHFEVADSQVSSSLSLILHSMSGVKADLTAKMPASSAVMPVLCMLSQRQALLLSMFPVHRDGCNVGLPNYQSDPLCAVQNTASVQVCRAELCQGMDQTHVAAQSCSLLGVLQLPGLPVLWSLATGLLGRVSICQPDFPYRCSSVLD